MRLLKLVMAGLLAACAPPPPAGTRIDGPYFLAGGISAAGGRMICYNGPGGCSLRIPAAVAFYGRDADYVVAAVKAAGAPEELRYYYLIRLFDHPDANGSFCLTAAAGEKPEERRAAGCAVRGPFTRKEFDKERRRHCVPVELGSDKLKCMPDAVVPA